MRRLRGWFSLYFMFCSQVFICECDVCGLRCGESVVQSAEMVACSGVCVVGCGGYMVGFLYVLCFVRRNSFANVVFAVGDAAKVRFGVPKWLCVLGFATVVRAVANGVSEGLGWFSWVFHLRMLGYGLVMRRLPGWFSLFQCGEKEKDVSRRPKK